MSNQINFTQEKWNIVLDLKDMVNSHSKTINKMAKIINSQQQKIQELEKRLENTRMRNNPFDDITKYGGKF